MKEYAFKVPAYDCVPVPVRGNFISLSSGSGVRVRTEESDYILQEGQGVRGLPLFDRVELWNDTAADAEVVLRIGVGEFIDNRVKVAGRRSAYVPRAKIVNSGATIVIPANPNRKKVGFQSDMTNIGFFWLGGVIDNGHKVKLGDYVELEIQEELTIIGTNAGDVIYWGEEVFL